MIVHKYIVGVFLVLKINGLNVTVKVFFYDLILLQISSIFQGHKRMVLEGIIHHFVEQDKLSKAEHSNTQYVVSVSCFVIYYITI